MLEFNFGNAIGHFSKTGAPPGFTWKFALSYILVGTVLMGISLFAMRPLINFYIEFFVLIGTNPEAANDSEAMEALLSNNFSNIGGGLFLMMFALIPLSLAFWAVFEATIQRRYMRQEGFRLQFGADELRLMVVGLVVFLLLYAVIIVAAIIMGIVIGIAAAMGSPGFAVLGAVFGYILMIGSMIWYFARMSAASALTIRDEKIRLFESFIVTRGRVWPIVGVFLVVWIGYYVISTVIYMVGFGVVFSQVADLVVAGEPPDMEALFERLTAGEVLTTIIITMILAYLTYGLTMIISGGPGALAALNDPRNPNAGHDPAAAFS